MEHYYFHKELTEKEYLNNVYSGNESEYREYKNKCQKWAPLMQSVRQIRSSGMYGTLQGINEKKYLALMRNNILAMARYAFPEVEFKLKLTKELLYSWTLSYKDGPTEEELRAKTNFELFTINDILRKDNKGFIEIKPRSSELCSFACEYLGENYGICVTRDLTK